MSNHLSMTKSDWQVITSEKIPTDGIILTGEEGSLRLAHVVAIASMDINFEIGGFGQASPGHISASGDLSPLAYVAGLIEGNPDTFVQIDGRDTNQQPQVASASDALKDLNITPVRLQVKEALGIMNGTTPSAAAALALYDASNLAILTRVLTAMSTEALYGTEDNYHEFIAQCRPHPGKIEAASLVQDRYALRTASQWIGPVLEDLVAASRQANTELNSTTDNTLIDVTSDRFHHVETSRQAPLPL
ncbi:Phenylalanine aminomutase (L-beta-phenylalanine forming) [Penicillium argentinense]|uniref:Phenylalanine aminomutase (L-beta-phenylalanine forming) n=1 Tax=Penicillium argentinense TaxID=1131581 RepID=A0A9W9KE41_9EURO|nr:Phenylalanine aminomutase (L-beta-phenylalanine forming) [Penicillium argentinense]KAJ5103019.1 Phenylalanine aminomutase (L-beta-phenylalanine forming) [Penicillium argentinense]